MNISLEEQVVKQLMRSQNILLLPSAPADGDSLGSALALYRVLSKLGKKVTVITAEPVPQDLQFLPLIEKLGEGFDGGENFTITVHGSIQDVQHSIKPGLVNIILTPEEGSSISAENVSFSEGLDDYDLFVTVDTGDLVQLGKFYEKHPDLFQKVPVINIDHHASNGEFGTINYVDIKASATTEMLVPLIQRIERESGQFLMDADIATLLLAGIITDTGSFQHSNTTPKAFQVAAQLLDWGARQQEIIKHVYKTKSLSALKLWGKVLSDIQFERENHFVWSTITQRDLLETGAKMEESGAIIDELLNNAPGAEVVILLKEKAPGLLSASVRTTTAEVDASAIAGMFGGGGHKRAAGFRIKGMNFDEAVHKVVSTIREIQGKRHGIAPIQTAPQQEDQSTD
jgi:bifunctional oligoribonuclease and PAP phosphatase NrnA